MINVIICDRQKENREIIRSVIKTSTDISISEDFNDYSDIDLAFIDVDYECNGMDGIKYALMLQSVNPACRIIFISEVNYYNEDIYDVDHTYLLHKPLKTDSVTRAFNIAAGRITVSSPPVFRYSFNGLSNLIPLDTIVYFEKSLRKIIIHTCDGNTNSFYAKYEDIEDKLDKRFLRCHNGIIVNMDYVTKYYTTALIMNCGRGDIELPVSRTYRNEVKESIGSYLKL